MRKSYNPERRAWKGRSYKKGGKRVRSLKDKARDDALTAARILDLAMAAALYGK